MTRHAATATAALLLVLAGWAPAAVGQTPTFAPVVNYDLGTNGSPAAIVAADLNGDDKLDLLTANYYSSTVGVLLGTGAGHFGGTALYSTGAGSYPSSLAVTDVNGDGHLDVLTANSLVNTVSVLLGTGTGALTSRTAYSTGAGSNPRSLAVADVNGDGYPDVLTANTGSHSVGVLLATGTGSFGAVTAYSTGPAYQPLSLAVADVNGDGQPDVLTAHSTADAIGVLLGTGQGGLGTMMPYALGLNSQPFAVAVADVNGDGHLDLLTANSGTGTAGVLLGTGTGGFGAVATYSTGPASQPLGLAVADVNGDGHPDLLAAQGNAPTVCLLLGTGTGSFGGAITYSAGPNSYPHNLTAADVNGDGKLDLLTANSGNNTAGVLLSTIPLLATHAALPGAFATLYPNPARAAATLTVTGLPAAARTVELTLLSSLGQLVRRLPLPAVQGAATGEVPTAGLATGLYLLHLRSLDGQGASLGVLPPQRLSVE